MNMTEDCISSQPFESANSFTSSSSVRTAASALGNCRQSSPSLSSSEQTHLMMLTQADHHHHNLHHHHHHHRQHQHSTFADAHSMAAAHQKQSRSASPTVRPFSDLSPGCIVHNGDLFGPIPNLFKWLQLQMTTIEQNLTRSKSPSSASPSSSPTANSSSDQSLIDIAMNKEEQNLEIIYQQGNYYLEAVHSFRVSAKQPERTEEADNGGQAIGDAKPKAWLAKEIEQKLSLKPGKSWLNGVETYYCLMCNLFSSHSNLLLLHMILTCPKLVASKSDSQQEQQQIHSTSDGYTATKDANNNGLRSPNQQQQQLNSPPNKSSAPKRSFDIMSLLQQQEITNIAATPEYSRISSDDDVEGEGDSGEREEEDSDEKIDVETLEEADCGATGGDLNRTFGLLKPAIPLSEMAASPQTRQYQSFSNGSRVKANSVRGASKYPRGKSAKNTRVNSRTQNPKGAYNPNGGNRKMKAVEPESLEMLHPSSTAQFSALQRSKGGGESLMPSNLMPNLANLYSQFGPSLLANTFASFFHPQPSGLNGQHPPPPPPLPLPPTSSLPHNSSAAASSLLGPALEQVFSSANYLPPTGSLPPLPLPPPPHSSSLFSPSSAHHFGGTLSAKYNSQHSPSSVVKGAGLGITASPYNLNHHHRPQHPFEQQSLGSGGGGGGGGGHSSSSLVTASNSPSSTLSDSQSGGSPSSGSSSSNSLSPSISISPKSEYDQIMSATTTATGGGKRSSDAHHHHQKESGKSRKNSHHHHSRSSQSPTTAVTANSSANSSSGNGSGGSQLNLPPYFLPPSSTASSPLISSMYLLSPSLTALSYQASNVCAYCGTAFRMTSDLVYHMRSHHKRMVKGGEAGGEGGGGGKKRRNDALKCNICQETFRERHHLTRHMTSHQ